MIYLPLAIFRAPFYARVPTCSTYQANLMSKDRHEQIFNEPIRVQSIVKNQSLNNPLPPANPPPLSYRAEMPTLRSVANSG